MKRIVNFILISVMVLSLFSSSSFGAENNRLDLRKNEEYKKMDRELKKEIDKINEKVEHDYVNFILNEKGNISIDNSQSTSIVDPGSGSSPAVEPGVDRYFDFLGICFWDENESGAGAFAQATGSLTNKTLSLRAWGDPLWSTATAWGTLGRDFFFDSSYNKTAYVRLKGSYKATLLTFLNPTLVSDGSANLVIRAELWDTTTGSRLESRTIYDETLIGIAEGSYPQGSFDETFETTLRANHSYKATIYVECKAIGRVTGSTRSTAYEGSGEYIKLDSVSVTF